LNLVCPPQVCETQNIPDDIFEHCQKQCDWFVD
jgi:hypothetical protein